jgi:hypothetical protein
VARNGAIERLELEPGEDAAACGEAEEVLEVWDVVAEGPPAPEISLTTPVSADGPGDGDAE